MTDARTSTGEPAAAPEQGVGATVSVGHESRAQVAMARGLRDMGLELRSLRPNGVELVGSVFLPKQCQLELELTDAAGAVVGDLNGVVRKVQMIGPQPKYAIWVGLDRRDLARLAALEVPAAGVREPLALGAETLAGGQHGAPRWASLLVGQGRLTDEELKLAIEESRSRGVELDRVLSSRLGRETVAASMAMDLSVPFVEPRSYRIALGNSSLVPEEVARRHGVFPLFDVGGVITLGMRDPTDLGLIDQVRLRTKRQVDPCLCSSATLDALIDQAYRADELSMELEQQGDEQEQLDDAAEGAHSASEIARLVQSIVTEAARGGASDIHIEPERKHMRVRVRVDGVLHELSSHPRSRHASIVSRIKVQAKMDIAETRRPQDGHFTMVVDRQNVDVRVSTIPTVHGENVVLRLLLSSGELIRLEDLGMPEDVLRRVDHFLAQPNGMMLVTGPTGSGKTTTLYSALGHLNTIHRNIVTVEDPVERRIELLRQTQVNPRAGVTFASGLRSILRQDPDVIMVGEIRDLETAEIAVQAALTGHLVLSTLHTNTAAGAIVRLSEMGIAPYLITSSLRAVVSQRLVRRVCASCAAPAEPDPQLVRGLGLEGDETLRLVQGRGCAHCMHTGYKGRVGIYEILEITPGLGKALIGGASRAEIEREGVEAVGSSLRDNGLQRVREGITTLEEIARTIGLASFRAGPARV